MLDTVVSKPIFRVLTNLTQENRLEVALPLAIKDLVRLKQKESRKQLAIFEQRYGMDFSAFKQAWDTDQITDKYSYEVERDYWEWEAAMSDAARLQEMQENLL